MVAFLKQASIRDCVAASKPRERNWTQKESQMVANLMKQALETTRFILSILGELKRLLYLCTMQ